jgi:hypothetical protein
VRYAMQSLITNKRDLMSFKENYEKKKHSEYYSIPRMGGREKNKNDGGDKFN